MAKNDVRDASAGVMNNSSEQTSLWYSNVHTLAANAVMVPMGVVVSILVARILGPEGKGCYDLILATAALLGMVLGFSLPSGIIYAIARQRKVRRSLLFQLLFIGLLEGFLALMVLETVKASGYSKLLLPPRITEQAIVAVVFSLVLGTLAGYWRAILVGGQEIVQVNHYEFITRSVFMLILFGFVSAVSLIKYEVSVINIVWSSVITLMLANLLLLRGVWSRLENMKGPSYLKEVVIFSLPCFLSNVAQFLNYRLDVFIVNFFVGVEGVGLYALAVSVAQLIWLISNSAATILLPRVASSQKTFRDNVVITAQMTRVTFWLSCISGLFLALLANYMLPLLYGESFRRSVIPFLWLLPGVIAFSLVNVLASYIAGMGKPRINLYISSASLVITVALNLFLIPRMNITGAAIASTISYSASAVLTVWIFIRQSHLNLRDILLISPEDIDLAGSFVNHLYRRTRSKIAG